MNRQLAIVGLVGLICLSTALAQASDAINDVKLVENAAKNSESAPKSIKLTGVLVSGERRTALVNGRPLRVGDRLGSATLTAIEDREIRMRVDSREFAIRIGATVRPGPGIGFAVAGSGERRNSPGIPAAQTAASNGRALSRPASHVVSAGETLSGIAQRLRRPGATSSQLMIALFESNPGAFGSNINILREGAVLRVPDEASIVAFSPAAADAEVLRHMREWQRPPDEPRERVDEMLAAAPAADYGPVRRGESLSQIVAAALDGPVSLNQAMLAVYEANPEAFGDNINILLEGAMLRLPSVDDMRGISPDTATAIVLRHEHAWRDRREQQLPGEQNGENVMASVAIAVD